ncbi:unnamed protein product, partial [Oikopleura dioica]
TKTTSHSPVTSLNKSLLPTSHPSPANTLKSSRVLTRHSDDH